jgi:hypothetical protein
VGTASTKRLGNLVVSRGAGRIYWAVNLIALAAIGSWICADGKFSEVAVGLQRALTADVRVPYSPLLAARVHALQGLLLAGLVSGLGILAILLAGSQSHRSIRGWFAAMTVCAAWLALLVGWPELAWQARGWRVGRAIGGGWFGSAATADEFAETLLANWPTSDGDIPALGPFSAYPIGRPTTLLLAKSPTIPGTKLRFNTVERDPGDHLHFQLTGSEAGVWLVWGGEAPRAFTGGLATRYEPARYQALGGGWYLVEYRAAPLYR